VDPKRFEQIQAVFNQALKLRLAERPSFLSEACGSDADLRQDVDALLAAHEDPVDLEPLAGLGSDSAQAEARQLLEQIRDIGPTVDISPPRRIAELETRPDRVGPYKILEQIGEGGMGTVYLAEQAEPIRRRVALKIIKLGMDTKQVIARFEIERQALAMMDHPNVAKVLDAGATPEGRPYFVMEHVQGERITDYCDRHRLTTKERLLLFMDVCHAVQHAHQKAIIHRDIKPSNILVTVKDGNPIAKVIDFGVAKATDHNLTEHTVFTEQGQLIGTPEYMSPEQAEMSALSVDTRTDIYSLGVVLYELLAGALPFDSKSLRRAAFNEIQRIIREVEPPRPSTRLSSLGDDSTMAAQRRRTDRAGLERQLRGELDWITMKAMDKDRTRRYAGASYLADDIARSLRNEPVAAGPPSATYRLRKLVYRNRRLAVSASLVWLALVVGLGIATVQWFRAEANGRLAELRAQEATESLYRSHIALANVAWRDNDAGAMKGWLRGCPEHLREWEWRFLAERSDMSLRTLRGSDHRIGCIAVSPDGTRIVSGGRGNSPRIWNAVSGEQIGTLSGHKHSIGSVAFSPDGTRIVSGSLDNTIRIWDAESGENLGTMVGHDGDVYSVTFSPDGTRIVSGSQDNTIRIWDAESGENLRTMVGHSDDVYSVAFSPNGTRIVSGSLDKTLKIWNATNGTQIMTLDGHDGLVRSVAYSPNGTQIVSGSADNTLKIWDASDGEQISTLRGHGSQVFSVIYSVDGTQIVSASADKTLKTWDATNGEPITTLRGHDNEVSSVAYSSHGTRIVSGGHDKTLKFWDATPQDQNMKLRGHDGYIRAVSYSPDGARIVSGGHDKMVRVWDTTGREIGKLEGHDDMVSSVTFCPDGRRVVSGSWDKTLRVWDATKGELIWTLPGHKDRVSSLACSPDGARIVSGSWDKTLRVWDATKGKLIWTLPGHDQAVKYVAYSPDGTRIVSASFDKTLKIWDATNGQETGTLTGHTDVVFSVAYSPDGTRIVSASPGDSPRIWNADNRKEVSALPTNDTVAIVAYSPNGKRIVSISGDNKLTFWDAVRGEAMLTLNGQGGSLSCVAFSPDGAQIVTGNSSGTLTIWDAGNQLILD
jgi:WD40 repeat protein/serine/threonine protein kinase